MAGASIVACGFIALAFAGVARLSLPAILALAEEISHQVSTRPAIMTGVGAAVIDVDLAVVALPTVAADALVHTDFVDAGASVAARVALAVVDVLVAVGASEALLALAAELAPGLAPAAPVRSAHVRRDVALSSRRAVGRHCDRAAVNHFTRGGATVVFEVRAVFALVVLGAGAVVVCGQVEAGRSVLTRVRGAVIDIQLAEIPRKAGETQALEAVHFVLTAPAVQAGRARAFVEVPLAVLAGEARWARATIAVYQILASSPILALVLAVVYIGVAVLPRPTGDALAEVSANQVAARVGIDAGLAVAFVGIYQTRLPRPLRRTETLVTVNLILAGASVVAGVWRAVVNIDSAGGAAPACCTLAFVALAGF